MNGDALRRTRTLPAAAHRLLIDCQPDPEDPASFELRYAHGNGFFHLMTITYLVEEPFRRAEYYFRARSIRRTGHL